MAAHKKEEQINLLPERGFEQTTTGRILNWILSSFRVIVIITEIIVMIAFLSRFWLDAQNTDLSEEIQQKQAVLLASQDSEKEFKDAQKRLKVFTELTKDETVVSRSLNTIRSYLPDDIILDTISFSKDAVHIEGLSPNERAVQQLIINLDSTENFEDVSLIELKSDQNNTSLMKFNIEAKPSSVKNI